MAAADPRVTLLADPPSIPAIAGAARVLVNTVQGGSGVNLKSVEMLFSAAHLVSTPAGVQGLPDEAAACFAVHADAPAFARAVAQALASAGLPAADAAARAQARAPFAPAGAVRVLAESLRPLLRKAAGMSAPIARRPVLGVDFHVWDGIFQGSRSHLIGLYRAAIVMAPEIDFVFFLGQPDRLAQAHAEFTAPHVRLVEMPHRPAPWRLGWQLPRLQRQHRLDLLHMQYRLPFVPAGPCACTIHDVLYETHPQFFSRSFVWQSRLTGRSAARRSALLFTVSEYSRDQISRLYGVPRAAIGITKNGVDFQRFQPGAAGAEAVRALGLEPGNYLLTLGRLEPRKNHVTLLRAYARLGPDAPPLVIVGQRDFSYEAVFEEMAQLQLGARVRLLDRVDDVALPAVLRHAQAVCVPGLCRRLRHARGRGHGQRRAGHHLQHQFTARGGR